MKAEQRESEGNEMPRLLPHPGGQALESLDQCHDEEYGTNDMYSETMIDGEMSKSLAEKSKFEARRSECKAVTEAETSDSAADSS
eukprot:7841124-Alexandrium_andersonii.AAC.1